MPSHFSCIGIQAEGQDELEGILRRAAASASWIPCPRGNYLRWSSGTGAEIWLQVNLENEVVGAQPHFDGTTRMSVRVTATIPRPDDSELDGAFHCWANPDAAAKGDSGDYPLVFDAPDFHLHAAKLILPHSGSVQLAAFAEEIRVFPSEAAYDESTKGSEPAFAVESFIPMGLFGSEGAPAATALVTGKVVKHGRRHNPLSDRPYLWAVVSTFGGPLDTVIDPDQAPEGLADGKVIQGTFWLSGRFQGSPPGKGRRLLSLLRGRR